MIRCYTIKSGTMLRGLVGSWSNGRWYYDVLAPSLEFAAALAKHETGSALAPITVRPVSGPGAFHDNP